MDETDHRIVEVLRRDARISVSNLAATVGVSRITVRNRLRRLQDDGVIVGFTAVLAEDTRETPVRGLMMLGIEGRGTDRVLRALGGISVVRAIHTTNGKWDVIVELGTDTLEQLDDVLASIRRIDGVMTSETNLLLATRMSAKPYARA